MFRAGDIVLQIFCWRPPIKRKQSDSWEPLLIKDFILGKIEIDCSCPYTMIDLFLNMQLLAVSGCRITRVFDLIRTSELDVFGVMCILKIRFLLNMGTEISLLCYVT